MIEALYGTWESPISAELVSSAIVAFQQVVMDGEDIYWSEMRPLEKGRTVIVKKSPHQSPVDILPLEFNARTRVHEYGGASFTVHQGVVYFTHFQDQRLYKMAPSEVPVPLTKLGIRFADFSVTQYGIIAIAEMHENPDALPKNFLALISLQTGEVTTLASGYDFYAFPTLNKHQTKIAWICWNHPNMPWDNTELWVAKINENGLFDLMRIDGGNDQQSFFQPQWDPEDQLVVVSDQSNWWNLYQVKDQHLEKLFSVESELGQPLWNVGASTWAFYQEGIVCSFFQEGKSQLFYFKSGHLNAFELPFSAFSQIHVSGNNIAFIGGSLDKPTAVALLDNQTLSILRENTENKIDAAFISHPVHITFPSRGAEESYGYYYAPTNPNFQGFAGTKPPLIVKSHGGPTANCGSSLNLEIQYWTSRGFAVVDVNYAGSTGYGRQYRKRLESNWGIFDVQDCEAAAHALVKKGLVDEHKLAITGGSAGGYTTLAALTFTDTFHVGASHYGVSDLEALVKETHKFESRYLDKLIGPYPQEKERYWERSPIHHIDKLSTPVIFFQGDEDKIVLPNQAEMMFDALKQKGVLTEYHLFQGEQHGFRKAENRIIVLESQRRFFMDVFNDQSIS